MAEWGGRRVERALWRVAPRMFAGDIWRLVEALEGRLVDRSCLAVFKASIHALKAVFYPPTKM